jgi:putative transposase
MNIQPIIEGQYFHIYNRGVNGENLFREEKNYYYFLEQYRHYCAGILETLAYCLLKNHFHLLVRIKENIEIPRTDGKEGTYRLNASKQLGHLFNSYAQSVNKAYNRTGPLFESPFERKLISDETFLISMIYYCHRNPVHHGFVSDWREWTFSSYHPILKNDSSVIAVSEVIKRFGNTSRFEEAHQLLRVQEEIKKYIIEY